MEPAEAPELRRRKMSVERLCFLRRKAPPPRKLSINHIVLNHTAQIPMIRWLLSQKSPLFVFMSPGSPEALQGQDPTVLLAALCRFAMASSTSSSRDGWEPDAQLCASVSPAVKHGKVGGGGEWLGKGPREVDRVPVGCPCCSPPHLCLSGGHRCPSASVLEAQDQAPGWLFPPHGKKSLPALSGSKGLEREWSRKARRDPLPPDTGSSPVTTRQQKPGCSHIHLLLPLCTSGLHQSGGSQLCIPLPSPRHPCAYPFLPQFP